MNYMQVKLKNCEEIGYEGARERNKGRDRTRQTDSLWFSNNFLSFTRHLKPA